MSPGKTYVLTVLVSVFMATVCSGVFSDGTGCKCVKANHACGCCADVKIKQIGLDDEVCAYVAYLPKEYGINVLLTIDKHVVINETVSARNPPPICVAVPHMKKFASVCVDFSNLDISKGKFSGCVALEARLYHVFVEKVNLGCFHIGLDTSIHLESHVQQMKEIVVAREKQLQILSKKEKDSLEKFIKL